MLYLGSIGMDNVISEPCYKGTILQRDYRKMTIGHNSFVRFHSKKCGSHNRTVMSKSMF